MSTLPSTTFPAVTLEPAVSTGGALDPFGQRYTDVTRLGGGVVTDVYRCYDTEAGHWVTLKALNPITGRRMEDRERFLREPKLMTLIEHSTIPKIFGLYRELQPAPFFTMEYVNGSDLCQILHGLRTKDPDVEAKYPLERLVEIIIDACEGFAAAHEKRVLHRDIKPENIMVDVDGTTHLIDWGVSKPMCPQLAEQTRSEEWSCYDRRRNSRLTRAGQQPGTLLYMSSEQVVGLMQLDERADVYSLGAVLYDCLALTTYIRGVAPEEIIHQITSGPQLPPSRVTSRHSIPKGIEEVCMKALAMKREDRYANMFEFAEALRGAG